MSEMYGVDFAEDDNEFEIKSRKILGDAVTPSMISFLKRIGIAKNDSQALTILMLIMLGAFAGTYFLMHKSESNIIVTKDGLRIPVEEYVTELKNGIDINK